MRIGPATTSSGFQTKLTYGEQKRVFRMIPALEQAEFLRYGSSASQHVHQLPALLRDTLQFKARETLFFAGQLVGVEGYTDSAAMGGLAGINAARGLAGLRCGHASSHHGPWLSAVLHHHDQSTRLPADEHELRSFPASDGSCQR